MFCREILYHSTVRCLDDGDFCILSLNNEALVPFRMTEGSHAIVHTITEPTIPEKEEKVRIYLTIRLILVRVISNKQQMYRSIYDQTICHLWTSNLLLNPKGLPSKCR